jgi:hypothetical protein
MSVVLMKRHVEVSANSRTGFSRFAGRFEYFGINVRIEAINRIEFSSQETPENA